MKRMNLIPLLVIAVLIPLTTRGAETTSLQQIESLLDENTVVVGRLNLERLDLGALATNILDLFPEQHQQISTPIAAIQPAAQAWLDNFRNAGGKEIYGVLSLSFLSRTAPGFVAVPMSESGQAERFRNLSKDSGLGRELPSAVIRNCFVAGPEMILQRLEKTPGKAPRHLQAAFASAAPGLLQVVLMPYADSSRVIEEMLPTLPAKVGGGPGIILTRGFLFASLSLQAPPEGGVVLTIQSQSADDAKALREVIVKGLAVLGSLEEVKKQLPQWPAVQAMITPTVQGDTLRLSLSHTQIAELAKTVLMPALQQARGRSVTVVVINNLKQIGLAMLMYANDNQDKLPPHLLDCLKYLGSHKPLLPPNSSAQLPADFKQLSREAQIEWLNRNSDLVYLRAGAMLKSIKDPGQAILAYERVPVDENPSVGVLFADGHVEIMKPDVFEERRKKTKE
jgi:prepilin-type processing-associated H-X9-DG protein